MGRTVNKMAKFDRGIVYKDREVIVKHTLYTDGTTNTVSMGELVRCKDCKNSEHWYADRRRCFLWHENGVSVFDDGFCNYGERKDGDHA